MSLHLVGFSIERTLTFATMDFLETQQLKHLYIVTHQHDDNKAFDFRSSAFQSHQFFLLDQDIAENLKFK